MATEVREKEKEKKEKEKEKEEEEKEEETEEGEYNKRRGVAPEGWRRQGVALPPPLSGICNRHRSILTCLNLTILLVVD